jgi:uncharacterized protein (DUF305 family)
MGDRRTAAAAVAIVVAVLVGAAGFALGRTDAGRHRDGASAMHGAPMAGGGAVAGAMPGMRMGAGGTMSMDDRAFIAAMIPHHRTAIEMARIQLQRGTDPAARAIARGVVAGQGREIARMRDWYREWWGTDPPKVGAGAPMGGMGMAMDTAELRTGDEPDRTFLRMMIPHHAGAITMAEMVLAGDGRPAVADLARRIVAAQAAEIGRMQALRERIAPPLG